jgi:CBS domain-containing protein
MPDRGRIEEEPMRSLPKISEFMDQVVPTLDPDTKIMKAVDFLLRHRVTGAPVVDRDGKLIGMITETDLLKLITAGVGAEPPTEATVADFMTTDVVTAAPSADIYYVAGLFLNNTFRRIPVVEDGKIVGAITRFDLLRVIQSLASMPWLKVS